MNSFNLAKQLEEYVIGIQRDLHKYPELGLQEVRTIKVVTDELKKMDIPYEIVPDGGIIGFIEGKQEGKSLVLRADLDALPMQEEGSNLKHSKTVLSQNDGVAHTCGHDGHTAMLLGAAKILSENRDQLKGKVILAFEQGEEMGGGIFNLLQRLIEIGADGVWGIHLKSDLPTGRISVEPGPRMASAFGFHVLIKGKGGHGSRPDLSVSPVDCFTDFYNHLKAMRLTSLNPFQTITFSIGSVQAGNAANVIPDTLQFSGTSRFLQFEQGKKAEMEFKRLLDKTCELHQCSFEYIAEPKAFDLLVYNQEDCAAIAIQAVKNSLGEKALYHFPAWMASESFGLYQKYFPGVFAFLGIENPEKGTGAEHHNPHFEIDEEALKVGVAATVQYAIEFLKSEKEINFKPSDRDLESLLIEIGLRK